MDCKNFQSEVNSILVISATDSGGCSGMQADLRVCASMRIFPTCAVTAVTVQNSKKISGIMEVPPDILLQQLVAARQQQHPKAIKIGLLPSTESIETIAQNLSQHNDVSICDPVLSATAGNFSSIGDNEWCNTFRSSLLPAITLITPNLPELQILSEQVVTTYDEIQSAAKKIMDSGVKYVLVKGGHGNNSHVSVDYLFRQDNPMPLTYTHQRISSCNMRGTGCSLSTAIACYIARGYEIQEAVHKAITYLQEAIRTGVDFRYDVAGPLNHFAHQH